jgi:hypothetical protein
MFEVQGSASLVGRRMRLDKNLEAIDGFGKLGARNATDTSKCRDLCRDASIGPVSRVSICRSSTNGDAA